MTPLSRVTYLASRVRNPRPKLVSTRLISSLADLTMPLPTVFGEPGRAQDFRSSSDPRPNHSPRTATGRKDSHAKMRDGEPSLIEGFVLCLWDPDTIRSQSSRWKRSLLVFSSGVCVEVAILPQAMACLGYEFTWPVWLLTLFFLPLGITGIYASKFGTDYLVESLLLMR